MPAFKPNRSLGAYGTLDVICGPMFAGKSTELLKRILWARDGLGRRIRVLKPAFDVRYGATRLASHDGLFADAEAIAEWPLIEAGTDIVFLDEVQFLEAPHFEGDVIAAVRSLLARGVDVVAAGLDADWRAEPFEVTGRLLAMADRVTKLHARCSVCGQPASKNFKKVVNDLQVELGEADLYEARCNAHWHARGAELGAA